MEFIFGISGILVGTVIMIGFIMGVFEIIKTMNILILFLMCSLWDTNQSKNIVLGLIL